MSRPLKFPDHGNVMDVRRARYDTRRLRQERQRREAGRQGFILNKVAVAAVGGAGEGDGLGGRGVPYHHYLSAQCTKDQKLLAARSEATLYHDPLGRATTSLLHTNTGRGSALPKLTASKKLRLGLTPTPVRLAVAAAVMQSASELAAGRLGLGRGGDACLGLNAEVKIKDLIDFTNIDVPLARSLPGDFALGLTRSPEGEVTAGFGSSVQYRLGAREMLGLRTTFGNRGRAGLSLRAKTVSGWWLGLVAMAVPLGKLLLDTASDALRRWGAQRRLRKQQRLQQQKLRQQQQQALERQQKLQQEQQQQKAKGAVPKTVGKAGVGVGKAAAAAADGKKGGSGAAARLASGKPGARPKK
eukprot:XP_001691703.1 predicted protein [Chlamydomonas reinhardtii]